MAVHPIGLRLYVHRLGAALHIHNYCEVQAVLARFCYELFTRQSNIIEFIAIMHEICIY